MTVFEGLAGCSPCPAGIWSAETHRSRPAAKIERLEAGNMCVCVCVCVFQRPWTTTAVGLLSSMFRSRAAGVKGCAVRRTVNVPQYETRGR